MNLTVVLLLVYLVSVLITFFSPEFKLTQEELEEALKDKKVELTYPVKAEVVNLICCLTPILNTWLVMLWAFFSISEMFEEEDEEE